MNKLDKLKSLIEILSIDINKFYGSGNKAASIRARKVLQKIKEESQNIRMDISKTRNSNKK